MRIALFSCQVVSRLRHRRRRHRRSPSDDQSGGSFWLRRAAHIVCARPDAPPCNGKVPSSRPPAKASAPAAARVLRRDPIAALAHEARFVQLRGGAKQAAVVRHVKHAHERHAPRITRRALCLINQHWHARIDFRRQLGISRRSERPAPSLVFGLMRAMSSRERVKCRRRSANSDLVREKEAELACFGPAPGWPMVSRQNLKRACPIRSK